MEQNKKIIKGHFDGYAQTWHDRLGIYPYRTRFNAVKRRVDALSPQRVTDIGCGCGDYSRIFDGKNVDYLGIDLSEEMIRKAKEFYPDYAFQVSDGDSTNIADNDRDLVLDVAVLEYYDDPLPHFRELYRITKPGGTIIVTAPNKSNRTRSLDRVLGNFAKTSFGRAIRRLIGRKDMSTRGQPEQTDVLHTRFTVSELFDAARKSGLEPIDHCYLNVRLMPEVIPFLHRLNICVSECVEDKKLWRWLTRYTATITLACFRKPDTRA